MTSIKLQLTYHLSTPGILRKIIVCFNCLKIIISKFSPFKTVLGLIFHNLTFIQEILHKFLQAHFINFLNNTQFIQNKCIQWPRPDYINSASYLLWWPLMSLTGGRGRRTGCPQRTRGGAWCPSDWPNPGMSCCLLWPTETTILQIKPLVTFITLLTIQLLIQVYYYKKNYF